MEQEHIKQHQKKNISKNGGVNTLFWKWNLEFEWKREKKIDGGEDGLLIKKCMNFKITSYNWRRNFKKTGCS